MLQTIKTSIYLICSLINEFQRENSKYIFKKAINRKGNKYSRKFHKSQKAILKIFCGSASLHDEQKDSRNVMFVFKECLRTRIICIPFDLPIFFIPNIILETFLNFIVCAKIHMLLKLIDIKLLLGL